MLCDTQNTKDEKLAHILIVEDESLMSKLLSEILSSNYAISIVETVKNALEVSYQELPDLILCDIKLPDGSGLKILETLKKDERTAHIPILVISSLNSEQDIVTGLEHGADDYISKPFVTNELLLRIKSRLENRQRIISWCRNRIISANNAINSDLPSKEQQFLEKLKEISETLIQTGELSIDALAREMAHSKRQLQRKVKEHLNCSCSDYIFGLRMEYASCLSSKGYTTKEITSMIGYKDVAHFSRIFKKYLEEKETAPNE